MLPQMGMCKQICRWLAIGKKNGIIIISKALMPWCLVAIDGGDWNIHNSGQSRVSLWRAGKKAHMRIPRRTWNLRSLSSLWDLDNTLRIDYAILIQLLTPFQHQLVLHICLKNNFFQGWSPLLNLCPSAVFGNHVLRRGIVWKDLTAVIVSEDPHCITGTYRFHHVSNSLTSTISSGSSNRSSRLW